MSNNNCIPLMSSQKKQSEQKPVIKTSTSRKYWCIEMKQLDIKDPEEQRKWVMAGIPIRDNIVSVTDAPGPQTLFDSYHEAERICDCIKDIIKDQSTWSQPLIVEVELVLKM